MAASNVVRKKSPRAPSIALDDALDKALKIYGQERLHPAPTDLVAQHMGYKDANNGRALAAIASVRYYGLVERSANGLLCVTKEVENYLYAPSDEMRYAYLRRFLTAPVLFAELLERYSTGLPSDGNLRYELIQRDFLPATAETLVGILKRSVEFAKFYQHDSEQEVVSDAIEVAVASDSGPGVSEPTEADPAAREKTIVSLSATAPQRNEGAAVEAAGGHDRIPVRLSGGRRAWLLIPREFYVADKQRLKAQIDLLLAEDES